MNKFIKIKDYDDLEICINVNHIKSYVQFDNHCEIELSSSKKITSKLKLEDITALINN